MEARCRGPDLYKMRKVKKAGAGVPLLPQAKEILQHYESPDAKPDDLVFPALKGKDRSTPRKEFGAIASGNTETNGLLKEIQKRAKIKTTLTTHPARHSIAWHLMKQGWDVYRIKEVLGHENIETTEKYLAGFDTGELDEKYRDAF